MTLVELCEPLFQYVCRLNRSARKGGNYEMRQVVSEVRGIFGELNARAAKEKLSEAFGKVEIVLLGFVDSMIKESALPWAHEWKDLAAERGETQMNSKFFDLLDATLKDSSPAATERLGVFYICLGLGFTGIHQEEPEFLQQKAKEIASRLQMAGKFTESPRICADAYEYVDVRDLIEPPGTKVMGIGIALAGLILVLFVTYGFLYRDSASTLTKAVQAVQEKSAAH